jgi:hypothetical protein
LRIELVGAEPPVWREVRIPREIPLTVLHWTIQSVMGWQAEHLHGFARGNGYWGAAAVWVPEPRESNENPERDATLGQLLGRGRTATYMYDFGDDWEHRLTVQATDPADIDQIELVDGRGGFMLENVGGVYGLSEAVSLVAELGRGGKLTADQSDFIEMLYGGKPSPRDRKRLLQFDADAVRRGLAQIPVDGAAS